MNISEIEARSGLPRATVRYYEAEGFLSPERRENDYRDYSEEDLNTLLKLKLLRALNVPLQEIRAVQDGTDTLEHLMQRQSLKLRQQQEVLSAAERICREIGEAAPDYRQLDARPYLEKLEQGSRKPVIVPKEDKEKPERL